ncbi:MAG: type II toxin-antitoxin system RelB/DinJ family antitoxin [Oscillospiraceae bacterium]
MAKNSSITIRTTPETKSAIESLYAQFGITVSDAVNIFFNQSLAYNGLPFAMRLPNKATLQAIHDTDNGVGLSPAFENVADLMQDLAGD